MFTYTPNTTNQRFQSHQESKPDSIYAQKQAKTQGFTKATSMLASKKQAR
jgi:hypothetical protein